MKWKIIIVLFVLCGLTLYLWESPNAEKAAHASFPGIPPVGSKPYNVMDYTKPAPKP